MIELNLLPKEMRKKKSAALPDIPLLPIAILFVIVLLVIHVITFLSLQAHGGSLKKNKKTWADMQPMKKRVEELEKEKKEIQKRLDATKGITSPDIDWAELLSGLNQAVIPNVWCSTFKPIFRKPVIDQKKGKAAQASNSTLEINGFAMGKSEVATSTVAKFIDSLRRNQEFSRYFDDIELQAMNSQIFDGEEVMSFKLICKFKQK